MINPNKHIFIYTHKTTPRIKYIFHFIFKDCLGLTYTITNSIEAFRLFEGYKLSYSHQEITSDFHITSTTLLFESGIKDQPIQIHKHEQYGTYFFKTYLSQLPFDLFAASFYLISRYEEYLPFIPDQYHRFEAEQSLAYQNDFLQTPIVNQWVSVFEQALKKKFPHLIITKPSYSYLSTIDIDNAYQYKQKGVMRTIGGYIKSIIKFNKNELIHRTLVLLKKKQDPYDSYQYQLEIQKKHSLQVIYFYLLGDYGINDKNHPSNNKNFQKLIKHLSDYSKPGIHPSFGSYTNSKQIKTEINRLAKITHQEITRSRQHFTMLKFPDTYSALIEVGITDDYSMGYPNYNGFRASVCLPFYWYDLDDELETNLKIHPYCLSEVTLRNSKNTTKENYNDVANNIISEVKKHQGELITIFHNDTMGLAKDWIEWNKMYEEIVKISKP